MHQYKILALCGTSGSGKDYIGRILHKEFGMYPLPLSLQVKIDCIAKYGASYEDVFVNKPPQIRSLLQQKGTEEGRDVFGQDVWIMATLAWAQYITDNWGIDKFVITDVRFENEFYTFKNLGIPVYKIVPDETLLAMYGLKDTNHTTHRSESELEIIPESSFDGIIYNEYTHRPQHPDPKLMEQLHTITGKIGIYQLPLFTD